MLGYIRTKLRSNTTLQVKLREFKYVLLESAITFVEPVTYSMSWPSIVEMLKNATLEKKSQLQ